MLCSHESDADEFDHSVKSALSLQGLALLFTAIYQTFRVQITLFHAICVLHLLALLGINVVSRGKYNAGGGGGNGGEGDGNGNAGNEHLRKTVERCFQIFISCVFIAFNVYIWLRAPQFGSQPECNGSTLYVVFGVSIHATAAVFRWIILGTFAIVPGVFVVMLIVGLPCWITACCFGERLTIVPSGGGGRDNNWSSDASAGRNAWVTRTLQVAGITAFSIYAIVSLEQTIRRNHLGPEEREWTFGQVIALFLLLGTANEIINVILAGLDRRRRSGVGVGNREGVELGRRRI